MIHKISQKQFDELIDALHDRYVRISKELDEMDNIINYLKDCRRYARAYSGPEGKIDLENEEIEYH